MVFCCVGNDHDLRAVMLGADGALAGTKSGALLIDHTTASADVARELFAAAKAKGADFVDAPVSGGEAGAINGMLTVMCGGESAAFERAKPVAMAFSKAFTLMGDSGAGQLTKMVNQICIAGLVQALSEGIAFGQKAGLDMAQVLEVIGKGAAQRTTVAKPWWLTNSISGLPWTGCAKTWGWSWTRPRETARVCLSLHWLTSFMPMYKPWAATGWTHPA
jgi:3-hydroxyisobutyrate dehydrogenase-like beta-hydroxyacid dehydrogenase